MDEIVDLVQKILIERRIAEDKLIFGEIKEIAKDYGIEKHIILNENVIVNAFNKQIPKKPRVNDDDWLCCRSCGETFSLTNGLNKRNKYCGNCGQALDWSDNK